MDLRVRVLVVVAVVSMACGLGLLLLGILGTDMSSRIRLGWGICGAGLLVAGAVEAWAALRAKDSRRSTRRDGQGRRPLTGGKGA